MKKIYFLLFTLISFAAFSQTTVFVNELHYDNASTDIDEAVEIAGPAGTDLTSWTIVKYNGSNNLQYGTENLSGTISDQQAGYGTLNFLVSSFQNGSPDAIALVNDSGVVVQFLSYEGVITAADGPANGMTSTDIGVAETSSTPVGHSLQLVGTGDTYEEFTWATTMANTNGAINTGQTFSASNTPTLTITAPSDGAVFNPGTSSVTLSISVQNFVVDQTPGNGGTGDGHIHWTIDSGSGDVAQPMKFDANDESIPVTDGGSYFIIMELVDNDHNPIGVTAFVGFDVSSATQVADIAALRADVLLNGTGMFYELMNSPTVTYVRPPANRNQKYIQDGSAGILIDDNNDIITTTFAIGDGMSGLIGQTSEFNGVLQFVPLADASVVAGATITPEVVTIATLLTSWEDYESELIQINDAFFTEAGGSFATSTNYTLNDPSFLQGGGGSSMTFRTNFAEVDYIGQPIPVGNVPVVALVLEFGGAPQVTARSLTDVTLTVDSFESTNFNIYPNPVSNGILNGARKSNEAITIAIFDILGKQVISETLSHSNLNISSLNTGIYIMKITQNGNTITKKLVVR